MQPPRATIQRDTRGRVSGFQYHDGTLVALRFGPGIVELDIESVDRLDRTLLRFHGVALCSVDGLRASNGVLEIWAWPIGDLPAAVRERLCEDRLFHGADHLSRHREQGGWVFVLLGPCEEEISCHCTCANLEAACEIVARRPFPG